jgi:hypothetical protein
MSRDRRPLDSHRARYKTAQRVAMATTEGEGDGMYIFTRSARLAPGQTRASQAWAAEITEKVTQVADLQIGLWTPVFSPGVATLIWSALVEDLGQLEAANAKLAADDGFAEVLDRGAAFASGDAINDELCQIVYGEVDPQRQVSYIASVRSTIEAGKFSRGYELGVELAQRVEAVTGDRTLFCADATGTYGGVRWITGYDDIQALQASNQAVQADTSFGEFVDQSVAGVYQAGPGLTTQAIFQRII